MVLDYEALTRATAALVKMAEALGYLESGHDRGPRVKADLRHTGPGRRPAEFIAVNDFQIELEALYAAWIITTIAALTAETPAGRDRALVLSIALALLLADVESILRRRIFEAAEMGRGESVREAALLAFALAAVDDLIRKLSAQTLPQLRAAFDGLPPGAGADELQFALVPPLSRLAAIQAVIFLIGYNLVGG